MYISIFTSLEYLECQGWKFTYVLELHSLDKRFAYDLSGIMRSKLDWSFSNYAWVTSLIGGGGWSRLWLVSRLYNPGDIIIEAYQGVDNTKGILGVVHSSSMCFVCSNLSIVRASLLPLMLWPDNIVISKRSVCHQRGIDQICHLIWSF